jgi:hypothetical protein
MRRHDGGARGRADQVADGFGEFDTRAFRSASGHVYTVDANLRLRNQRYLRTKQDRLGHAALIDHQVPAEHQARSIDESSLPHR